MKKKVLPGVFIVFLLCFPLVKIYSFDIILSPLFEYRNTRLGEYVVLPDIILDSGEKWLLSELQWQSDFALDFGLKAELAFKNISFLGKVAFGLPFEAGYMIDEDFIPNNEENPSLDMYFYSKSNIYLDQLYDFSFSILWTPSIFEKEKGAIALGSSIQFRGMQFTAKQGTQYEYNAEHEIVEVQNLPGKSISYKQDMLIWWVDSVLFVPINKKIFLNFYFSYSPFWYGKGYDRHYFRGLDFLDIVKASDAYKFSLDFLWRIKQDELSFSLSYLTVPKKTGPSSAKNSSSSDYVLSNDSLGGISLSEFSASISYCFYFSF